MSTDDASPERCATIIDCRFPASPRAHSFPKILTETITLSMYAETTPIEDFDAELFNAIADEKRAARKNISS